MTVKLIAGTLLIIALAIAGTVGVAYYSDYSFGGSPNPGEPGASTACPMSPSDGGCPSAATPCCDAEAGTPKKCND